MILKTFEVLVTNTYSILAFYGVTEQKCEALHNLPKGVRSEQQIMLAYLVLVSIRKDDFGENAQIIIQ